MKRPKLSLVTAVKDKIACGQMYIDKYSEAKGEDRRAIQKQFREAYISKHVDGCCPDAWIGDSGVLDAIITKFRYVLEAVKEEASRRTGIPSHHVIVVVEPCLEGSTFAAILHDAWNVTGKKALCWFESTKAWCFCWDTEAEMEEAMEQTVLEVVEVVRKVDGVAYSA